MAVIFAAIGGGAVIAAIAASDDYGDHSDYSAYSNQAEQERKRKLETAIEDLSTYKKSDINPMLYDKRLKEADAMEVSEVEMSMDVQSRAEEERKRHNKKKGASAEKTITEIDRLLARIDAIQEE